MAETLREGRLIGALLVLFQSELSAQVWEVGESEPVILVAQVGSAAGSAIAAGDFDCDSFADLFVGVPLLDNTMAGAVNAGFLAKNRGGIEGPVEFDGGIQYSVASGRGGAAIVAGDFNGDDCADFAVGIPGSGSAGSEVGTVHVFESDGEGGLDQNLLVGPLSEPFDHFGEVLAVGDFDDDGFDDLAVGVPGENVEDDKAGPTQLDAGAVAILFGGSEGLSHEGMQEIDEDDGTLASAGAQGNAHFGFALAAGDFDDDGYDDLAVGVPDRDVESGGTKVDAGQVVVLFGSLTGLSTTGHERLDDADFGGAIATGDQFGYALAAADFDLSFACLVIDCYVDLAIGIPGEPNLALTQTSVGGLVVAYGSSGLFATAPFQFFQQDNISGTGTAPETGDRFASVLAAGSLDGRIGADLAVGVPDENWAGNAAQGVVHLLFGGEDKLATWTGQTIVQYAGFSTGPGAAGDRFGASFALGDFDGDGLGDAAIGVPGFNRAGVSDSGSVQYLPGALFADGFNSASTTFWSDTSP